MSTPYPSPYCTFCYTMTYKKVPAVMLASLTDEKGETDMYPLCENHAKHTMENHFEMVNSMKKIAEKKDDLKEVEVEELPFCDLCKAFIPTEKPEKALYDGKTKMGPWGYMCEKHFSTHGVGLGTGMGQKLILKKEGEEDAE